MEQDRPQKLTCFSYVKMHGFHGNHRGFEDTGVPTKLLIFHLLIILDY